MLESYVVVKNKEEYGIELQPHDRGYETKEQALDRMQFLKEQTFTYIAPLGQGSNKLGTSAAQDKERETTNEKIKKSWRLKNK
jgi:hypothetical protein